MKFSTTSFIPRQLHQSFIILTVSFSPRCTCALSETGRCLLGFDICMIFQLDFGKL